MSLDLGTKAIELASRLGASYADIRIGEVYDKRTQVRNGSVSMAQAIRTCGFGVRVLVDGAWGFAGSIDLKNDEGGNRKRWSRYLEQAQGVKKRDVKLALSKPIREEL